MKVIVIEDRSAIRTVFSSMINRMGHEAFTFDDFDLAFDACKTQAVDAIFVDMEVKGIESLGYKALSLLRATQKDWIPMVVMSMDYKPEEFLDLVNAGADDCLFKPIDPTILKAKLVVIERISNSKKN